MARTIESSFAAGRNNFDLLRLLGAWLVLLSHSFALTGQAGREPLAGLTGGRIDAGRLAVGMFFAISGFLVSRSLDRHTPAAYLRARLLRIWPGLAAVILLQTLLLGPLIGTLPAAAYFADPATWQALGRGLLFSPARGLPGVFAANPLPDQVNGSLWTLRFELLCYLGLLAAARLRLLRLLPAAVAACLAGAAFAAPPWPDILACLAQFAAGSCLWRWRGRLPHRPAAGLALATATLFAPGPLGGLFPVALAYAAIGLALTRPLVPAALDRLGDISYGTYLYAFPVQQALLAILPSLGPCQLAGLAVVPVLLCAVASSRLVERPALRLRLRLRGAAA